MEMIRFAPRVQAVLLLSTACIWVIPDAAWAQSADPAIAPPPVAAQVGGIRVYSAADFARFAPRNALDMLRQVPGFIIRQAVQERGLGQASENVLLNGQRVSNKSGGAIGELEKMPASNVERIEIVDAVTLDLAGLTGQVANVITRAEKKASGQFSWRPEFRAHYTDPILTRGDVSYSGQSGPLQYTLGLNSQGSRGGAGGPTVIIDPVTGPFELRDDRWHSKWDSPRLSGRFTYDPLGSSIANLNLAYAPTFYSYSEEGLRERPDGVDRTRTVRTRSRGFNYEVGGDYGFGLGSGQLKLIGLRRFDREPATTSAIIDFADGSASIGDQVRRDGQMGEWIGRGEYGWKTGSSDWQVSAEGAFNTLNSATRIFILQPGGEFEEIPFPAGTGRVHESRYEMLGTYGQPLGDALTLQLVAGGEYSRLSSQSAGNSLERSFFRPKGSVSLAWKAHSDLDISLRIRRRVEQLNFYDFLASVNLTEDRQNAGNLELVPPQAWEIDLEGNQKLGSWGNTSLRLFGRLIDDIVDIIPIGETGQSPGNIDRAQRYGVEWKGTWLFDNFGWTGAKLDSLVMLQRSRVRDPLTREMRPISNTLQRQVELNLRHDVPGTSWAWGANFSHFWRAKQYHLTEVGRQWEGPVWLGGFVEHKDVLGLTVQASVGNILNARSRWERDVYSGFRDSHPLLFLERRDRLIGPIFSFSVRGSI
jgi:outer membrane receptor for ferrienterochelin and colicins